MPHRVIVIALWLLVFLPKLSYGQKESYNLKQDSSAIVLIAPKGYFTLLLVEEVLGDLEDRTGKKLFQKDKIINFNDIAAQNKAESKILKEITLFNNNAVFPKGDDPTTRKWRDSIISEILKYGQILQLNVEPMGDLIDYSFTFYKIRNEQDREKTQGLDLDEYNHIDITTRRFCSILINGNQSPEAIKRSIENVLKGIFPQSRRPPIAKINVDQARLNGKTEIFPNSDGSDKKEINEGCAITNYSDTMQQDFIVTMAKDDTLFLDAFFSKDEDTQKRLLSFNWEKIYPKNGILDLKIVPSKDGINCVVVPNEIGDYKVKLTVFDGVKCIKPSNISQDEIIIKVYKKPGAAIFPKVINSFNIKPFRKSKEKPKKKNIPFDLEFHSLSEKFDWQPIIKGGVRDIKMSIDSHYLAYDSIEKDSLPKIEAILQYNEETTDTKIEIWTEPDSELGIASNSIIHLKHKVYSPFYIGFYWTQNDLTIDPMFQPVNKSSLIWNENKILLHMRVDKYFDKVIFDLGLGWAFRQGRWMDSSNNEVRLTSLAEIEASFKVELDEYLFFGVDFFSKLYQFNSLEQDSPFWVLGSKFQTSYIIFNGRAALSMNLIIKAIPTNRIIINDYKSWIGFGVKYFI